MDNHWWSQTIIFTDEKTPSFQKLVWNKDSDKDFSILIVAASTFSTVNFCHDTLSSVGQNCSTLKPMHNLMIQWNLLNPGLMIQYLTSLSTIVYKGPENSFLRINSQNEYGTTPPLLLVSRNTSYTIIPTWIFRAITV